MHRDFSHERGSVYHLGNEGTGNESYRIRAVSISTPVILQCIQIVRGIASILLEEIYLAVLLGLEWISVFSRVEGSNGRHSLRAARQHNTANRVE